MRPVRVPLAFVATPSASSAVFLPGVADHGEVMEKKLRERRRCVVSLKEEWGRGGRRRWLFVWLLWQSGASRGEGLQMPKNGMGRMDCMDHCFSLEVT